MPTKTIPAPYTEDLIRVALPTLEDLKTHAQEVYVEEWVSEGAKQSELVYTLAILVRYRMYGPTEMVPYESLKVGDWIVNTTYRDYGPPMQIVAFHEVPLSLPTIEAQHYHGHSYKIYPTHPLGQALRVLSVKWVDNYEGYTVGEPIVSPEGVRQGICVGIRLTDTSPVIAWVNYLNVEVEGITVEDLVRISRWAHLECPPKERLIRPLEEIQAQATAK